MEHWILFLPLLDSREDGNAPLPRWLRYNWDVGTGTVTGPQNEGQDIPAAARNLRYRARTKKAAGFKPSATKLGDSGQPGMAVPLAAKQRARSVVPTRKMLG